MRQRGSDNDGYVAAIPAPEPDAHGQAAMWLVESLIFGLIDRSAISVADAIGIVDVAAEVSAAEAADPGGAPETVHRSVNLLTALSESLRCA